MPPWMKGNSVPRISFSFFIFSTSRKLNKCAAPGEAAAEAHHQRPGAGAHLALVLQFAEDQRNAGGGGVAVFVDVFIVLFRRDAEFLRAPSQNESLQKKHEYFIELLPGNPV